METPPEKRSVRAKRMIIEVSEALNHKTESEINIEFGEWKNEFPKIFEMIVARTLKPEFIAMMIAQFEQVENGTLSQHNASVAVGTMLVDKIVKPQIAGKK